VVRAMLVAAVAVADDDCYCAVAAAAAVWTVGVAHSVVAVNGMASSRPRHETALESLLDSDQCDDAAAAVWEGGLRSVLARVIVLLVVLVLGSN
jgi:hypothetical protein